MTALAIVALVAGALTLGVALGIVLARRHARRAPRAAQRPTVAELLLRLVRSSHSGVVVLSAFGDTVLHNPRAVELGIVRDNRVDPRARVAAERVQQTGEKVEVDLSPLGARGRQPEAVLAEAASLGDGFTVIEAVDHSDAVRLEATRRDFVANVSHELKTPVGAMALLAEAVLDAADDPDEVRNFGARILSESTRLGTLVTELIALSRLQGAERLPDLKQVDVDGVVDEALRRVAVTPEGEQLNVTADAASGLQVEGDRTLLVTALSNLLTNAVAYSPLGSPVSVSRRKVDGWVEIAVTDRGMGIAEDEQERVFERFYRVDRARSRRTGGTGLGLAIVKHVAANHGGEVMLWSRPGTGSTFTLRLPVSAAGPGRRQRQFPPPAAGRPRATSQGIATGRNSRLVVTEPRPDVVPAVAAEHGGTDS